MANINGMIWFWIQLNGKPKFKIFITIQFYNLLMICFESYGIKYLLIYWWHGFV